MLYPTGRARFSENSLKAPSLSLKGSATRVEPRGRRAVPRSDIAYWSGVKKSRECIFVLGDVSQTLRAERTTRHPRRVDGHVVPCERQLGQASSNDESDAW